MLPDFFIHKLYARKDTFYIQVGGRDFIIWQRTR